MAEPFGIVSGAVSIATAFTACVDCFEYVKLGRRFGRDFQTSQLSLTCARLRLSRWGAAVRIYDDPQLGNPNATPDELQAAKSTLFQILLLFENSADISKKYRLRATSSDDLSEFSVGDLDPVSAALDNKMRDIVSRRQKGASILKMTKWALFDGSEFARLIDNITRLINDLETLFPASQQQVRAALVRSDILELPQGEQYLRLLARISQGVDSLLGEAANQAPTGHRYGNMQITGSAVVMNGDSFLQGWQHGAVGKSHSYDGIVVQQGGNPRILNGNQYGGGKNIWDD
jgi:hypothetical protein